MSTSLHVVCPACNATNRIPGQRLADAPKCGKCHEILFTGSALELTDDSLKKHLEHNDIPVLVDFWAPWCGPCKMMAPAYEQAAATLEPHVRLAKLNTETHQQSAARFQFRSIPTLIVFQNGRELARQSGAMSAADIVRWARQATGV